ncbi:hypothetical protein GCM10027058_05300 [Microbacterium neimengense]
MNMTGQRWTRVTATAVLAVAMTGAGVGAANAADVSPKSECSGSGPDIAVSNVSTVYVPGTFRAYGDGGATLTISAGQTSEVHSDVSVSGSVSVGSVIAQASVTAGVTLGESYSVTQSASGSYTVPDGLTGQYIELGAAGRSFDWSAATYNSGCVLIDQQSGSSIAPTDSPYFYKSW